MVAGQQPYELGKAANSPTAMSVRSSDEGPRSAAIRASMPPAQGVTPSILVRLLLF